MSQPKHISEVMHQLVLNNPNDPYAQILRRCPFFQAEMLKKGSTLSNRPRPILPSAFSARSRSRASCESMNEAI